eukprot:SAG22_NODE_126_length_18820_cov_10.207788_11_plen_373_part_00
MLAGLQCGWIGFPGSTGSNFVDCLLADRVVAPPELARYETFNERLLYLPHSFTAAGYAGTQPIAAVGRQAAGLPPAVAAAAAAGDAAAGDAAAGDAAVARGRRQPPFVVGSFNRLEKLDPSTFRLWVQLALRATGRQVGAEGYLWLLEPDGEGSAARRNLRAEAAALGLPAARLLFAGRVPKPEHLGRLALADVFVDSAPYSAHTIAADALWAGLPLLACPAAAFSSRVSASMLVGSGLHDVPLPPAAADAGAGAGAGADDDDDDDDDDGKPAAAAGSRSAAGSSRQCRPLRVPLVAASWKEYTDSGASIAAAKAKAAVAGAGPGGAGGAAAEEGLLAETVHRTSREVGVLFDNALLTKGLEDVLLAALSED